LELVDHNMDGLNRTVARGGAEDLSGEVLAAHECCTEGRLFFIGTDHDVWLYVNLMVCKLDPWYVPKNFIRSLP
jgi:hypothetical protein